MAYNILVSDNLHQQGIDLLREREGFHVDVKTGLSTEDLKKVIGAYHGLVIRSATTTATPEPRQPFADRATGSTCDVPRLRGRSP
jgi:phosphoglycerate dehydrogenase-like enzyme